MPSYWRAAGVSYMRYSGIIAAALRRSTKPQFAKLVVARERHPLVVDKFTGSVAKRIELGSAGLAKQ